MKKKVLAIVLTTVLTLSLGLVFAGPVGAHTESEPFTTDLIAGQHTDVGDVEVWNDGDNLHVTYVITDLDWVITETHLYVGQNVPFTTAPGQFPYDDDDADSVTDTEVTYVIPLANIDSYSPQINRKGNPTGKMVADGNTGVVEPCQDIFIAAHAVVNIIEEGYTVTDCLVSGAPTDNVLYLDEDPLIPGYPLGYTGPYQPYPGTPIPSVLAWVHGSWPTLGVVGAQWISSSYYTENTDNNTWRLFTRSFTFPTNATNISGTLTMNCDNAEEVYLNGTFVGLDTYAPATKIYGMPLPPPGTAHGWSSVENWDVSSILMAGNNYLWTMTRNYAWSGGPTYNPTGLIYGLCYEYDIPDTVIATETAWGDGTDFDHPNWAMYFMYHVQGWHLVETLTVPANSPDGTDSSSILESGKSYKLKAMGTWRDTSQPNHYIDAEYTTFDSWATYMDGTTNWGPDQKDLQVNEQFVDWGTYSSDHELTLMFTGDGSIVNFRIFDGRANEPSPTIQPTWYPDNQGFLTVEIWEWS